MNFKKIWLLIITLGLLFTTETFAKFRMKPVSNTNEERQSIRKQKPIQNTYGSKKANSRVAPRQRRLTRSSTKPQNTPGIRKRTAVKSRAATPIPSKSTRAPRKNTIRKPAVVRSPVRNTRVARKATPVKNQPPAVNIPEQNGQWQAAYQLNNGTVVRRHMDKIDVYNAGFASSARGHHYSKGTNLNGMRLTDNIDLSLEQSQADFQKQVAKLGGIRRVVPM